MTEFWQSTKPFRRLIPNSGDLKEMSLILLGLCNTILERITILVIFSNKLYTQRYFQKWNAILSCLLESYEQNNPTLTVISAALIGQWFKTL